MEKKRSMNLPFLTILSFAWECTIPFSSIFNSPRAPLKFLIFFSSAIIPPAVTATR